ncbi:hypothetical protein Y886_14145 [Xanthomonas hyacinthi DSM 19077]|nr:hypothetical protein Y886_14145 [Xanthomonas hyacinthi DSM 19077]
MINDFAVANIPAGLGAGSVQILQAMTLVMNVIAQNPGAQISFTGHSLGGGLASMMSVFFDLPSTTFDAAPFQATAVDVAEVVNLHAQLAIAGFFNTEFDAYVQSLATEFAARESQVTSYYLEGEILELIRFPMTVIEGNAMPAISIGTPSVLDGTSFLTSLSPRAELHSMTLLQAAMYSEDFRLGMAQQRLALAEFIDPSLYGSSADQEPPNLMAQLMIRHLADLEAGSPLARLDAIGQDLQRIGTAGTASETTLNKGIIDALSEYYFFQKDAVGAGLVENVSGGISLDMSRFSQDGDGRGRNRLSRALWDFLKDGGSSSPLLSRMGKLVIQNGDSGLSYDGDGNNELVIGGRESDTLRGGAGDDYLYGLDGSDDLEGGAGNDFLAGGLGDDNYRFRSSDTAEITLDRIADSDGSGHIWFDGSVITVGQRTSEVAWLDSTGKLQLTFLDSGNGRGTLVIDVIATHGSIRVQDWAQGNLSLSLGGQVPVVDGSQLTGEDDLFGSNGNNVGADTIKALGGNDGLEGGAGDDHLDGGAGNDLILGGTGNDVLIGGEGNDYIYDGYERASFSELDTTPDSDTGKSEQDEFYERVNELGAAVLDHGKAWYIADLIYAPGWTELDTNATPSGDDMIDAGGGNDTVVAGDGNDIIRGGSGNDRLTGGYDNDVIFGEADDDTISGDYPDAAGAGNSIGWRSSAQANHKGNDAIDGGAGNDSISGNGGNDVLSGGDDNDRIWGRGMAGAADSDDADSDYIDGGAGDDILTGDDGDDVIIGGIGNDNIWGDNSQAGTRHGNDSIDAGAGNDFVSGGGGDDMIEGGAGSDTLTGDARDIDGSAHGRDLIHGGADNDIIDGGGGDDALYGDDGDDQIVGDVASDGTLAAAYHGNDYLDGGAGNDLLIGNGGNDQLSGGTGDDELQGGDGDDLLDGGAGKDVLHGEAGDDTLSGGDDDDKLYGGAGDDRLSGGTGVDTLAGGDGKDVLDGGDGNDILDGEAGNDTIYGGAGDDTIDVDDGDDTVYAGVGNDSIYAGAGNDVIHAEDGNDIVTAAEGDDQVYGGAGSDTLHGSAGNDTLYGEDGDDHLIGGAGNDTLIGGAGLNRYYFDRQFGQDVIELAIGSQDQIYLQQGIAAEEVTFTRDQDDLVLAMADGSSLRVVGYFATGTAAWIQLGDGSWISRELIDSGVYYGTVTGGSGAGENLQGTEGDDRLYGLGGNDTIDGQGGNDLIDGGQGNDTLSDGQGNDFVYGGAGNDVINLVHNGGGNGSDVIDGGAGDETYNVAWGSGYDVIVNLDAVNAGSDTINLVGISQNMVMNYQVDGNDLMIFVSGSAGSPGATADNTIVLEGFLANGGHRVRFAEGTELSATDFQQRSWTGTSGDDTYVGTFAPDVINGLGGNDTLSGMDGNDSIYGGEGDDVLDGGSGNDVLYGDDGNDIVRGGDGDDRLYMGFRGNYVDRYIGGNGNDAYYLNHNYTSSASPPTTQSSNIEEEAGGGIDTLYTNFYNATLGANVENLVYTPANFWWPDSPSQLSGNALDNVIQVIRTSSASHMPDLSFRLDGKGGKDTLMGSSSKETYVVDSADDIIVEQQTDYDSIDTVEASLDYSIETRLDLENIRLTGAAVSAIGNSDDNLLEGYLATGINQLSGLGGNDTYLVTRKDVVIESAGGGNDTVVIAAWDETTSMNMWVSVSDYANVENLTLYTVYGDGVRLLGNLRGDDGGNMLKGNMFSNEVRGGGGNDVIWGDYKNPLDSQAASSSYRDILYGEGGDDTIMSSVYGADLYGGAGNDILIGIGGAYLNGSYTRSYGWSDRFFYDVGGGTDRIRSWNGSTDDFDQVIFGEGVNPDDVVWSQDGTSLVIQVGSDPNDRLIVENYWRESAPGQYTLIQPIDEFVFADGTVRRGDLSQLPYDNNAPVANWFQLPATARVGEAFEFALPDGAFTDDADDTLTYSLSGPTWMSIDPVTGTISGTPPQDAEQVSLTITATDRFGESASTYGSFKVIAVMLGTEGDDVITGTARGEELYGLAGNDRLAGGGGTNVLYGGKGDDTYVLTEPSYDSIVELADEGFDTVESSLYTYTTAESIERVVLVEGSSAYLAYGASGTQELVGNSAANYLNGGTGADRMAGGAGDDVYIVDDADDVVVEGAGEGEDQVLASLTWTLSANVEIGSLTDGADLGLTGNDLANTLYGNDSNNALDGGLGADSLYGYGGDDTYYVDTDADSIVEDEGQGIDTIVRGFGSQYVLADNVENLRLIGSADQGNGNALDNFIEGSAADNTLLGLDGADELRGMAGNDTLWGGNGDDLLVGGEGDDMYVIDATTGSDRVDNTGGGTDWLILENGITTSQLALARDGDDLVVTVHGNASQRITVTDHFLGGDMALDYLQPASGSALNTAAINALVTNNGGGSDHGGGTPGTGNDADYPAQQTGTAAGEQIVGSSGRDLIKGLGGGDTLFGMGADDKLDGGDGNDHLSGGNGSFSGSGNDILIGGAGADQLVGEDGADVLFGGTGDDTYFYAAGSGVDSVDNTGGGSDWLYFDGIERARLTYHRDGDDLIVRVDGDAAQQMRVLDHFLGGEQAIAYVQPGDGGYAISAATIAEQLTPLGSASRSTASASLTAAPTLEALEFGADEAGTLAQAIDAFAIGASILHAPMAMPAGRAPAVRPQLGGALPPSASGDIAALDAGNLELPVAPSAPAGAAGQPRAELHQLIDSLASVAGRSVLPAANDMGFDELGIASRTSFWRMPHSNASVHLRRMEL